jgi:hypothetical protein
VNRFRRSSISAHHGAAGDERARDQGSALVFALIVVLLGSLVVTPLLGYARSVTRNGRLESSKASRSEAVKGGLRTVLADSKAFYAACSGSGLHNDVQLAGPKLGIGVSSSCTTIKNTTELTASELRVAMSTVQVGATAAPAGTVGSPYPKSGLAPTDAWVADTTTTSVGGKILLPLLPTHALTHPSSAGYQMPAWAGNCKVFFPGTYSDPITISGTQPVYFTSGIYYFENTLTFTGSANVVVGGGSKEGCASDQDAAYNAIGAPANHNISGYGATFILGSVGRLVVNDSVAGTGPSVYFNARLVADTDVGGQPSKSVSIVSVNGVLSGANSSGDLNLVDQLSVPKSSATASPPVDAAAAGYKPSTLVPVLAPGTQSNAIIDVSFTGTGTATFWVPGYVAVPQGRINISATAASKAGKTVSLLGGVLAALITQTADQPAVTQLGIVNRVVQKVFKVVSRTTSGSPIVVSTALVQINDYGEYVVNSWDIAVVSV